MTSASHHCQECDKPLRTSKRELHRCQRCGGEFCEKHIYTKTDGTISLCKRCFVAHYYGSTA